MGAGCKPVSEERRYGDGAVWRRGWDELFRDQNRVLIVGAWDRRDTAAWEE